MEKYTVKYMTVSLFNKENGESTFNNRGQVNSLKKSHMALIDSLLEEKGMGIDELSEAQRDILGLLVYNTCVTGIQTISMAKIMEKTGYSRATVARAKKAIEELGIMTVGYLGNGHKGKYVFVLNVHNNFARIMEEVFGLKTTNDTSCDTSCDTSSNSEIPCESKAEGQEKVSTLSTFNSLNTRDLENKGFTKWQLEYVRQMEQAEIRTIYKKNINVLASLLPKDPSKVEQEAFKRILKNQMRRVAPELEVAVKSYFTTMFQEEVKLIENREAVKATIKSGSVPFYNWLDEGVDRLPEAPKEITFEEFTSSLLNVAKKYAPSAPSYPQWQLEGFSSEAEYDTFMANNNDLPF